MIFNVLPTLGAYCKYRQSVVGIRPHRLVPEAVFGQKQTCEINITLLNAYLTRLDQVGFRQFAQHEVGVWLWGVPELQSKGLLLELAPEDVHERFIFIRDQLIAICSRPLFLKFRSRTTMAL